ncbi:MAG TPA: hypothetical protein VF068_14465 [Rubrobacter sp.]
MYNHPPVPLSKEELKLRVIEHLKQYPKTQIANIMAFGVEQRIGRSLSDQESQSVLELIHEFVVTNIVMTSADRYNTGWPWLSVTAHGRTMLEQSGPPVYDYDGYMVDLKNRVPDLDEAVERYVSESLRTYQGNAYLASMAMLGCASERSMRLLFDAYVEAIDREANRKRLKSKLAGRDISRAYAEFRKSFDTTRAHVHERAVVNDFDVHVDGVFHFIRLLRNSILHPTGVPRITTAVIYANLQQFSQYVETIFALISYYKSHAVTV